MRTKLRPRISMAAAGASAAAALLVACSTPTTETNVWKSPTYAAGPMKNIAVFAGQMNESDRRTLEDGFVSSLARSGAHAIASYTIFPQSEAPPDAASIRAKLQSAGYDGALVSTLKGVSDQAQVAPGADWAGGFYGAYWGPGAPPAYVQTDQFVKFETTLWNPSSGKMVWSTTTQTENPTSGRDFVASLTGTVVPSLAKAGLIPSRQGQPVSLSR